MIGMLRPWAYAAVFLVVWPVAAKINKNAPLPDTEQLMQRALDNEKKLAAEQERYLCRVTDETEITDSKGDVRREDSKTEEQFYVNGVEIDRLIAKNGKPLSSGAAKKESDRVMKETLKYSDAAQAKKEEDKQNQQVEDVIEAMSLKNGRREIVNGRSVLFYDLVPNPSFHAKNINQRFAQAMQGTISIDENTGEMIDINAHSVRDLKIAGGLLANLHKGFWIHVHNRPQPDGVWLTDLAEGSGDARAALFFHPYFRFRQTSDGCRLFTASAEQVGHATPVK